MLTALDRGRRAHIMAQSQALSWTTVVAALGYAVMLLFVWAPFAATTGMGWETYFTIVSEDGWHWTNFLYTPDPLRIHAAQVYELAYRLGDLLGIRGSFLPYELLYGALWWARSVLTFLLLRRLMPGATILPFTAGAILMVHAPDVLLGWLGQMHQFGYFVWLLVALHLLLSSLQQGDAKRVAVFVLLNLFVEYLCLWTYEGPLFIMAAAPLVLVFLIDHRVWRRILVVAACWYVPIAIYVALTFQKYLVSSAGEYQTSLLRQSFAPAAIVGDWLYVTAYSLSFWAWVPANGDLAPGRIAAMAAGVAAVFAAGAIVIGRRNDTDWISPARIRQLAKVLLAAVLLLFLSFPAHLMLAAARDPRRTQLLSGIAASIVLATICSLLAAPLPKPRLRQLCALLIALPIVFTGAWRTIERQASHRAEWTIHRTAMQRLLQAVPRIQNNTIVVMTNVPKAKDPFYAYHFWFNNALRLAYPGTTVAGVYYYDDGSPGPTMNLQLRDGQWAFTEEGVRPSITSADVSRTLALRDDPAGVQVLPAIPEFVCAAPCVREPYDPRGRTLAGPPADEARRRYLDF